MKDIDGLGLDEIICPYCGFEDKNYTEAMEVLRNEGDQTDWECSKCEKEFTVTLSGWSLYFDSSKEVYDG